MGTSLYSNPNVPEKAALAQMRHSKIVSVAPYVHNNRVIQKNLQNAISGGLVVVEERFSSNNDPTVVDNKLKTISTSMETPIVTVLKASNKKTYSYSDNEQLVPDTTKNNKKHSRKAYEIEKMKDENKKLKHELEIENLRFDDEQKAFKSLKKELTIMQHELVYHKNIIDVFELSTLVEELQQELTDKTIFIRQQAQQY